MAIWTVAFNANFTVVSNSAYSFLTNNFGWLYLMAMTAFVYFFSCHCFQQMGKD
ncbi:MAG: BCCT family transporter [Enterocloster clostridioformis]